MDRCYDRTTGRKRPWWLPSLPSPPPSRVEIHRSTSRKWTNHHHHHVQLLYRWVHYRWPWHSVGRYVSFAVLILWGRNLWSIHSSTTTPNIPPDLHVISHRIPTKNGTTELWNEYLARLPPVPWPVDSDGCYAEMGTRPYCQFHNLLIDLSRVASVNNGGEPLVVLNDSNNNNNNNATNQTAIIMGQDEDNEYLTYQPGAFQLYTERNTTFPTTKPTFAYVNDVLKSLQVVNLPATRSLDWNCTRYFPGVTLFLTRYEYVNLYHTVTDWWNTWTVYRYLSGTDHANLSMIFLDAHPQGNLDSVWETLFGNFAHLRRLGDEKNPTGHNLCFERAMLVPPGSISHLWPQPPPMGGRGDSQALEMMPNFVDFVLEKLKLTHVHKIPGHVVLIDRKPYLAHARSQPMDDRSLSNLPEVAEALLQKITNVTSVRLLQLHNMSFREQVQAVREAEVLVGVHGAGLTHLVFMDHDTHVVEFKMDLDFFVHLAECKLGLTMHLIPLAIGNVSERMLSQRLLPTFAKIYGQEDTFTAKSRRAHNSTRTIVGGKIVFQS